MEEEQRRRTVDGTRPRTEGVRSRLRVRSPEDTTPYHANGRGSDCEKLVYVSFVRSAEEVLSGWGELDGLPDSVLVCGRIGGEGWDDDDERIETLPIDTDDMTGLLVLLHRELNGSHSGGGVAVQFEGIEGLLRSTGMNTVYRFLAHTLGVLDNADARPEFYVDPTRLDEWEIGSIGNLFDEVDHETQG